MSSLTLTHPRTDYDPMRDKRYRDAALGPDVVAWLAWLELGGAADRTLDQYERDLSRACLMYPSYAIGDWTDAECSQVVRSWPKGSRRVRKAALDSFFRWAIRTRRIEKNPMDVLPSVKRPAQPWIDIFNDAETEALCSLPLRDGALMRLLLDTGLRKGEAIRLQGKDCPLDVGRVIVFGGKGGKDRAVPMTSRLQTVLAELVTFEGISPRDYLWYTKPGGGPIRRHRPIGEGSFARWWERCLRMAEVPLRKPHTTRHTFATRWRQRGLGLEEIQILLGHSSIQTTSDLYVHTRVDDVERHMALIEEGL